MNILPHKSWHVRTKKNIERVRRDEEKAADEEKERQRRIALAEQEARTELLRKKARCRLENGEGSEVKAIKDDFQSGVKVIEGDPGSEVIANEPLRHINFFSEVEEGKKLSGKNTDHEAEKKAEQEQLEMKIGLLTYLGQGSAESQTEKPWYLKRSREDDSKEDFSRNWKLKKKLDALDPMNKMVEYVSKKKSSHKEKHKHKKHKQNRKSTAEGGASGASQPGKTIAELRAERMKREVLERQKSEDLLRKLRGEDVPEEESVEEESRSRGQRYNSQYNPELLRQPRHAPHKPGGGGRFLQQGQKKPDNTILDHGQSEDRQSDNRRSDDRRSDSRRRSEDRRSDSRMSDHRRSDHDSDRSERRSDASRYHERHY